MCIFIYLLCNLLSNQSNCGHASQSGSRMGAIVSYTQRCLHHWLLQFYGPSQLLLSYMLQQRRCPTCKAAYTAGCMTNSTYIGNAFQISSTITLIMYYRHTMVFLLHVVGGQGGTHGPLRLSNRSHGHTLYNSGPWTFILPRVLDILYQNMLGHASEIWEFIPSLHPQGYTYDTIGSVTVEVLPQELDHIGETTWDVEHMMDVEMYEANVKRMSIIACEASLNKHKMYKGRFRLCPSWEEKRHFYVSNYVERRSL